MDVVEQSSPALGSRTESFFLYRIEATRCNKMVQTNGKEKPLFGCRKIELDKRHQVSPAAKLAVKFRGIDRCPSLHNVGSAAE